MPITDPAVAVAVINEAKTRAIYQGDMPESEGAKLAQANELLTLAEQAKSAGVQAEAVHAVIAAAQQEAGATSVEANPFGSAPAAAPAPVAAPPVEPEPADVTIDTAIPGYDDMKVSDILAAMENLNDAGVAFVKAYEAQDGERAKIMNFEHSQPAAAAPSEPPTMPAPVAAPAPPEAPAPVQGGVAFSTAQPAEYASTEPWAGFKMAKIKDIMAIVENVFLTDGEAAKPLLAHVWEYEKNNKKRDSLINKLTTLAQNGVQVAPQTQPAPAPEPTPAPVPEPAGVVAESPFNTPAPENAFTQTNPPDMAEPAPAPQVAVAPPVGTSNESQDNLAALPGATQRAQAAIAAEGLPIPGPVQQPPTLPEDFTALGDVEVRKYQSQFNACQARAHYLLAVAEGHANDAKIVADARTRAFIQATEFPAKTTVTQMEAAANADPEVSHAREVQHEFAELARQHKALRDIYQSTCERLSREQTGRANEHATAR